jgi:large subunit ribosomal protein L19
MKKLVKNTDAHPTVRALEEAQPGPSLPDFRVGDTVRVHVRIIEQDKEDKSKEAERIQVFEGVVIGRHGSSAGGSYTVRKVSYGVGVERIFPFKTPSVKTVEIKQRGIVRRSKLYYLRELRGRAARIRSKSQFSAAPTPPPTSTPAE